MERYFLFDTVNTWLNWHCILTSKKINDPTPNTNYVKLNGVNGSLDLSESLTGEITYSDRTITATFWTDFGTHKEREALLRKITSHLHGKKLKIFEPDDTDHYFYGRVKITAKTNNLAYATFTIEATCDPWKYAVNDIKRYVRTVKNTPVKLIINNNGDKTVIPEIKLVGTATITFKDGQVTVSNGTYKVPDFKLYPGVNEITVDGTNYVIFTYTEAIL